MTLHAVSEHSGFAIFCLHVAKVFCPYLNACADSTYQFLSMACKFGTWIGK